MDFVSTLSPGEDAERARFSSFGHEIRIPSAGQWLAPEAVSSLLREKVFSWLYLQDPDGDWRGIKEQEDADVVWVDGKSVTDVDALFIQWVNQLNSRTNNPSRLEPDRYKTPAARKGVVTRAVGRWGAAEWPIAGSVLVVEETGEWLHGDPQAWDRFERLVQHGCAQMRVVVLSRVAPPRSFMSGREGFQHWRVLRADPRDENHPHAMELRGMRAVGAAVARAVEARFSGPWRLVDNGSNWLPVEPVSAIGEPPDPTLERMPIAWVSRTAAWWLAETFAQAAGLALGTAQLGMRPVATAACPEAGFRRAALRRNPVGSRCIHLWGEPWPGSGDESVLRSCAQPWPGHLLEAFPPLAQNGYGSGGLLCVQLLARLVRGGKAPFQILSCFEEVFGEPWNGQGLLCLARAEKVLWRLLGAGLRYDPQQHMLYIRKTRVAAQIRHACEQGAAAYLVIRSNEYAHSLVRFRGRLYDPDNFTGLGGDWVGGDSSVRIEGAVIVCTSNVIAVKDQLQAMNAVRDEPLR